MLLLMKKGIFSGPNSINKDCFNLFSVLTLLVIVFTKNAIYLFTKFHKQRKPSNALQTI